MTLPARRVPSPLAVEIRDGAVESLAGLLADGRISPRGRIAVAVGPGIGEELAAHAGSWLESATVFKVEGGTVEGARALVEELFLSSYDVLVGIGGARTLDVAKYAGTLAGIPVVAVATNLAHDGIASPVASLEHNGRRGSYGVQMPMCVVIDLDYVRRAPRRQRTSGVGDVVAKFCAVADWELSHRVNGEAVDGLAVTMARLSAEAVVVRTDGIDSPLFLRTLAESLVLCGMAMAVAGSSRPCSGACHEISHAIDLLFPGRSTHGEQVAVGALFATFLREGEVSARLSECLARHGLPRTPADLGLDEEQFTEAVLAAPGTRPGRYTILEHLELTPDDIRSQVGDFTRAVGR
jgi:glycerol-1-phosphate dehydrogenase [NAD(P)+]